MIEQVLARLMDGACLSASEMRHVISSIMRGECSEVQIACLLTALRLRGESVEELVGTVEAMLEHATPIITKRTGLLDTCGTGGDRLHTFNISTATAFVVAAAGTPVAKHGNRSHATVSGSADVLEALGINIQIPPERVGQCLDELGIGFCFAPLLHGAMKHAGPVRKQLKFRTIFNLVGPLSNPARADFQIVGTSRPDVARKLAEALVLLGRRRAFVLCSPDQFQEASLWGATQVFEATPAGVNDFEWTPELFGLPVCEPRELQVSSPADSARIIRGVFAGEAGPARSVVLANAAAGLLVSGRAGDLKQGVEQATEAIDSGRTQRLFEELVRITNG
ncbi:MAG TPA: anthranilate phosphoribosyltransferase [Planctomycetaceae bacterium]|nr:anthranilate phosphoribosyltransferase [Planctomycetaceae bacterium]